MTQSSTPVPEWSQDPETAAENAVSTAADAAPEGTPLSSLSAALAVLREYAESIVITAVIFLFVITFVLQAYKIPTGSMESNLLIGDHLLANKFIFGKNSTALSFLLPTREIRRGDIIVFKYPLSPEIAYVKRVIGLPGEEIEIVGRTVLVNGKAQQEPYTQFLDAGSTASHYGPITVPKGSYFALGDNRDNSLDSRYWGFVPADLIVGRPVVVYWSYMTDRDEYQRDSLKDRILQIADVVLHFLTKTRWERTLKIVR